MWAMHGQGADLRRRIWWIVGGVVVLGAVVLLCLGPLRELAVRLTHFLMDKEHARQYILAHQPYSAFYFIGLQILQVVISPIPGELSCFLGGIAFGWLPGFIYSTIGLTLGSLIVVTIGRIFERVFLEKIIPKRILDDFESRVDRWGRITVFILFLIPGAPKDTMSYLFGLSRIPILQFVLVSAVARMPGTLMLGLQGAKVFEGNWTFFTAVTLGSLMLMVPLLYYRERILVRFGVSDRRRRPE